MKFSQMSNREFREYLADFTGGDISVFLDVFHELRHRFENKRTREKPMPNEAQIKRLYAIANGHGWDRKGVHTLIESNYGKRSTKDLTDEQYEEVCEFLEKSVAANVTTMKRDPLTMELFENL